MTAAYRRIIRNATESASDTVASLPADEYPGLWVLGHLAVHLDDAQALVRRFQQDHVVAEGDEPAPLLRHVELVAGNGALSVRRLRTHHLENCGFRKPWAARDHDEGQGDDDEHGLRKPVS